MIKVFFDSSVIFSGIYSQTGASAKLVFLVKKDKIKGITSQTVIKELKQNLRKLESLDEKKLDLFILKNNFLVLDKISKREIKKYNFVEPKDAHVVAGALLTKCNFLVTLHKKHLNNSQIKAKINEIKMVSPKEMLLAFLKL